MSIGFIGNNYQASFDTLGSGAKLELSLQNVLDRYDSITTDLDRLSGSAFYNTYDITSRQHYNAYNAESVNGWSESWYAEYRAVLQMRADSLQKKLQASYNRVLEKSAFAELAPDRESVFAPYANRTFSQTNTDFRGSISDVLVHDTNGPSAVAAPPPPPPSSFTGLDNYLQNLDAPAAPNPLNTNIGATAATANPTYFSRDPTLRTAQYDAFHKAIEDAFAQAGIPTTGPYTPQQADDAQLIADLAIQQLAITMAPVDNDGNGSIDYYPSEIWQAYGNNAALQVAGAPPINVALPAAGGNMGGTNDYDVYNPAFDHDSNVGTPAIPIIHDIANSNGAYTESQSYAANGNEFTPMPTLTPGVMTFHNGGQTMRSYGYQATDISFSNTTIKVLPIPPETASTTASISNGFGAPSGGSFVEFPPLSGTYVWDNGGGYMRPGTSNGIYTPSDFIEESGAGSTPDVYEVYLDELPMKELATHASNDTAGYNGTLSNHVENLFNANGLYAYKNGTKMTSALAELPPRNGVVVFKTKYPRNWYYNNDPRLGVDYSKIAPAYNPNPQNPAMRGWMQGNGLYTMIRNATNSGLAAIQTTSGGISITPGFAGTPATPGPGYPAPTGGSPLNGTSLNYSQDTGAGATSGGDGLYENGIPPRAAEYEGINSNNISNVRTNVSVFGAGVDIDKLDLFANLPTQVRDTLLSDPNVVNDYKMALADIKNSFLGRQYDDIYRGNAYRGKYWSADAAALIGLEYGIAMQGSPLGGLVAAEQGMNKGGFSFGLAGSGGIMPLITDSRFFAVGIGPDLSMGHLSAVSEGPLVKYGTIGVASAALSIPIPIPPPVNITIWLGGKTQVTRDIVTETIEDFFTRIKTLMVEMMQTQAYSASSGGVFDTYASKAENHFNNVGFVEGLKRIKIPVMGLFDIPIGEMIAGLIKDGSGVITQVVSLGSGPLAKPAYDETLNQATEGERMFEMKHGVQTPETRETDTGAFFATQAFLSQFSMEKMESEYWVGTQQNEELVDTDMLRTLQTVGTVFLDMMSTVIQLVGGSSAIGKAFAAVANTVVESFAAKDKEELWYKLFFNDRNIKNRMGTVADVASTVIGNALSGAFGVPGGVYFDPTKAVLYSSTGVGALVGGQVKKSSMDTEGYDYLESDHKPFEGDSDFNYPEPPSSTLGLLGNALGLTSLTTLLKAKKPPNVMDGYAATQRFGMKTIGAIKENVSLSDVGSLGGGAWGAQGEAGRSVAGEAGFIGDNGIWTDEGIVANKFDINEVYVGTRKVVFNDLENGFATFDETTIANDPNAMITDTGAGGGSSVSDTIAGSTTTRETYAYTERMIGASTRAYGKRYDGGDVPNFESFTTGLYSGANYKYDRKNQYSLDFKPTASTQNFNLFGSQALNPSIGGFIKMAEIEKNKTDEYLLAYEDVDATNKARYGLLTDSSGVTNAGGTGKVDTIKNLTTKIASAQSFGGSTDGSFNELNTMLYEHMHLRADGKNLSLYKEYRDVFNMGFMKDVFISGQAYHPSGGGITSTIQIKYDAFAGAGINQVQSDTRENYDASTGNAQYDPYNSITLRKSRGKASVYLNNYFASKKRPSAKR